MLVTTFALMVPLIRRRRRLVDIRATASNVLAGHLADSIANAETVRAFAREAEEAAMHEHNVRDFGRKTLRSWDYQNTRIDMLASPMFVLTNLGGLIVALAPSRKGFSEKNNAIRRTAIRLKPSRCVPASQVAHDDVWSRAIAPAVPTALINRST